MPLEAGTQVNVGIRPIERPQSSGGPDRIGHRTGGSSAEAFAPRTNVALQAAVDDMASILGKIASAQSEAMEKMPKELQEVIRNVLKQAFSFEETLGQGLSSTVESQRFTAEQLTSMSRMLNQMAALAEKGSAPAVSDTLQVLLTNLKAMVSNGSADSKVLEPVLLLKASFDLLIDKNFDELPQEMQQLLLSLQPKGQPSIMPFEEGSSLSFLKQLVQFFMPRPASAEGGQSQPQAPQQEQAQAQQGQQGQGAQQGQAASQGQGAQQGNQAGQGQMMQQGQATTQGQAQNAPQGQLQGNQQGQVQQNQSQQPGQPQANQGQNLPQGQNLSQGQNVSQGQPQMAQQGQNNAQAGQPQAAFEGQNAPQGQAQNAQGGQQANQGNNFQQGQPQGTQQGSSAPQGQPAAQQGQGSGAASQGQNANQSQQGQQAQQSQPGQPQQSQQGMQAQQQQSARQTLMQEPFFQQQARMQGQHTQPNAPQQEAMQQAKAQLMSQTMENTPQTMETMKDLAQMLLKNLQLTQRDAQLLQNFVNGRQTTMGEQEARQLQQLIRLCQQNVPVTVQQAALQQNIPDLPRLYAFMQLCDMANTRQMNARQLKSAGRDVAAFVLAMRGSMSGDNSIVQGQRALSFMMPMYLGENEQSYPSYIHVYDEARQDPETGYLKKENWLRLCVLTENIGAVELTCRVFDENQLDMRLFFSDSEIADEFRASMQDIRQALRGSDNLRLNELKVGAVGERRFI